MASPLPQHRLGAEAGLAVVPGYFVSDAVKQDPATALHAQLSAFFDPGDLLGDFTGLGVGARILGGSPDVVVEPMLRYRTAIDEDGQNSVAVVAFGTAASAAADGASYRMKRGGLELIGDVRMMPRNEFIEVHGRAGMSATAVSASGHYCKDESTGYGRDCDAGEAGAASTRPEGGVFPAGFVGITVELLRGVPVLHGVHVGVYAAAGTRPGHDTRWASVGADLTFGVGGY
jgi:hypothetical protein